ncbi:type IV toxin-antitoxin system AbiEi family antitoxin [Rhizobium sullae]|uniref:type IV toxin-antitoxin system AbiEi family antitoxin n=1 Tax=Rhizobium sullae TaxID=50338 RepID=UPI001AEC8F3B|nr:type IV toxin-antitoxin system AbiEi family antitoxin [Rhizobium sullae]
MKEIEHELADALRQQLERIPSLEIESMSKDWEVSISRNMALARPDILARVKMADRKVTLVCEVKEPAYPRQVRSAIDQLYAYMTRYRLHDDADVVVPVVGASWLSPESRDICAEAGMGWLDLAGNCRIAFDGVYIERETADKPKPAARNYRAVFSPKAGQVLRTLLLDPKRAWKVNDLAEASDVSLGHVSNVRSALRDREWAKVDDEGLHLTAPDALLDAWCDSYEPVRGKRSFWYSILHGRQWEETLRAALDRPHAAGHAMLGGLSAAQWLAPYLRGNMTTLYADPAVMPELIEALKLKPSKSGANVEVIEPDDPAILKERVEIPGAPPVSSPVLTYLDLSRLDDRGREAAEHLREQLLKWH